MQKIKSGIQSGISQFSCPVVSNSFDPMDCSLPGSSVHGISQQVDGETVRDFIFGAPKSWQMVTAAMKLKDACSLEEKL